MNKILDYTESQKDRYLEELIDFLKIPSISDLPEHKQDVLDAANWIADNIKKAGMENVRLEETPGHPIVYGEWLNAGADKPTVLIYGHYDVQPVDPIDEWDTPPFEPTIKEDGKIYARGTCDDKAQLFVHVKALEAILKETGTLPVNVKILFEGEEEAGSSHLDDFIYANKELLAADVALVSDTKWFTEGLPSISYALRGMCYVEVTVNGPFQDLHSGTYGGAVDNPVNVLCAMIGKLKDEYGRIAIPGFYDDVLDLDEEERAGFKELPFNHKEYCDYLKISDTRGEHGYTVVEQTWARPTLDVNGITGGFQGEGAKTIIPAKASAKISMRLVPHQNFEDIAEKVKYHLHSIAPPTVDVEVNVLHGGNPVMAQRKGEAMNAAMESLEEAFGVKPVFMRAGGSIPVTGTFQDALDAEPILMGLGLPSDNIHGPNEKFDLRNFYGGIKASVLFFEKYGKKH
jgi:acetylornithine deacetylase/succinyl-diaminopimelate desuccinylase-like protein